MSTLLLSSLRVLIYGHSVFSTVFTVFMVFSAVLCGPSGLFAVFTVFAVLTLLDRSRVGPISQSLYRIQFDLSIIC